MPKKTELRFIKLDPPPTKCNAYGSGSCCYDTCFHAGAVFPDKQGISLCGWDGALRQTEVRDKVNCLDCLELLHS